MTKRTKDTSVQLSLPIDCNPRYHTGLELKPKRGHGNVYNATGVRCRKFIVGRVLNPRGFTELYERNSNGFKWLLTKEELDFNFEPYNKVRNS